VTPEIIQKSSIYHRDRHQTVEMLVVHAMAEWVKDEDGVNYYCVDYLNHKKYSVHAYCLPDGSIIESISQEEVAYHAAEFNNQSIGMEFIVPGAHNLETFLARIADRQNPPFTQAQYKSGGWWFKQQAEKFGLNFQHIKTHRQLAPDRKQDPGDAFDWRIFKEAFEN